MKYPNTLNSKHVPFLNNKYYNISFTHEKYILLTYAISHSHTLYRYNEYIYIYIYIYICVCVII